MSKKNDRMAVNMVAQIMAFVINIGVNFFLTPFVTANVGKEVYGFVNLAFQATGYITILTSALNAMASRYITIEIGKKDYKEANKYFSSVILANAFISLVMMVPSVLCILYLDKIINVPAAYISDVKWLWGFVFAGFFLTLVTQFYGVSTYASNRLDLAAKRNTEQIFMKAMLLFVCFYFFTPKVWYIGLANFVCTFWVIVTNIYYTKKLTPDLMFKRSLVRMSAIKELISVGIWNAIQQLAVILINGCDMIIANLFINPGAMTLMGFAKTIPNYMMSFIGTVSGTFGPELTLTYAKGDMDEFIKKTNSAIKICGVMCSVPILGFITFGTDFFSLWLYTLNTGEVKTVQILSILILLQTIFDVYIYPLYTVNTITCRLKVPVLVSLGIGVANIIGSVVLCKYTSLGIYAIQIVSSVLLTARVFFFAPLYAAHILEVRWWTFYVPLLRGMAATVVILILFQGYHSVVEVHSWGMLIVSGAICGLVGYLVNFAIVLNKEERGNAIGVIKRKILKK